MTRAYLYKLFKSPLIYIGILGVAALCALRFLNDTSHFGSVIYQIDLFFGTNSFRKLVTVFSALPFAANFSEEWKGTTTTNCVLRRGVNRYTAANALFCWVTSLLTVFLGVMLFAGVYSMFIPFYAPHSNFEITPYGILAENGHPLLFLALRIFAFAESSAMWTMMGLVLSAFCPNKYIAVCSPLVASYVIEKITMRNEQMNLYSLAGSYMEVMPPIRAFMIQFSVFGGLSMLCGLVFHFIVKRRVRCEFG